MAERRMAEQRMDPGNGTEVVVMLKSQVPHRVDGSRT